MGVDSYPSNRVLDIATEVARREVFCRLKCGVKGCGGYCNKSSRAYLDSLPSQRRGDYLQAKDVIGLGGVILS
jgi:hypothetical protein